MNNTAKRRLALIVAFLFFFSSVVGVQSPVSADPISPWYSITNPSATASNPTISVQTDYTFDFDLGTAISHDGTNPDAKIYVRLDPYNQGYDLSNITDASLTDFPVAAAITWDSSTNTFTIVPSAAMAVGSQSFKINGIKNPTNKSWPNTVAQLYMTDFSGSSTTNYNYLQCNLEMPKFKLTADKTEVEVNLRDKITIELTDSQGNALASPEDLVGYMNGNGDFYSQPADVVVNNSFTISEGQSKAEIYFRPASVGDKTINISVYKWGGTINSNDLTIKVNPSSAVEKNLYIHSADDLNSMTAGNYKKINIERAVMDQNKNNVPYAEAVEVNLEAVQNDGTPTQGKLYASLDANGKPVGNPIDKITIPANSDNASFYYYDEKATQDGYTVGIEATASDFNSTVMSLDVNPALSDKIVIDAMQGTNMTNNESKKFNVRLIDRFGNKANPQPKGLTVDLKSTSVTGEFYNNYGSKITQITFTENWWSQESGKAFAYTDKSGSGKVTLTAETNYVKSGTIDINISSNVSLDAAPQNTDIEINQYQKLDITLRDSSGAPVIAENDVVLNLHSNGCGKFYKYMGNSYNIIYNATIQSGSSSTTIYYRSNIVNKDQITLSTGSYGGVKNEFYINVIPAKVIKNHIEVSAPEMKAGQIAKIDIKLHNYDQYYNEVPTTTDVTVKLSAMAGETPKNLYKTDSIGTDGKPNGVTVTDIVIPKGTSEASVYYYDEKATVNGDYSVNVNATATGYSAGDAYLTINPADPAKIELTSEDSKSKTSQEKFTLTATLLDKFGNKAYPLLAGHTIDLTSTSASGEFFADESLNNEISQLVMVKGSYAGDVSSKVFYYKDATPSNGITITAKSNYLSDGTIQLDVKDPISLDILPSNKTIEVNLNNKVTITLKDKDGKPFAAPADTIVYLSGNSSIVKGEFYQYHANNYQKITQIIIPAGQSSVDVYYRGEEVGEHIISASINEYGGLYVDTAIEVTPASSIRNVIQLESESMTAGVAGKFKVVINDQYGNPVNQEKDLEITLEALKADGKPAEGKLYKADANGQKTDEIVSKVIVPAGSSSAYFYYYDTHATNDPLYKVNIKATAGNLELAQALVNIKPAIAQKAVIKAVKGNAKAIYEKFELEVSLLDKYGNKANPQVEPLTLDLQSTTSGIDGSGRFYGDKELSKRMTQITFPMDWWTETNGQAKKVYYLDSKAKDGVEVKAFDKNLESVIDVIDVLPLPAAIEVKGSIADNSYLIHRRDKLTINLKADEAKTQEFKVHDKMLSGLNIALSSNPSGKFYAAQVGGAEIIDNIVNIPAGQSSIDVYFEPYTAGNIQITAGISYGADSAIGIGTGADIVWVLDHSGSMQDDEQNIAQNISKFATILSNNQVSYNLGFLNYADSMLTKNVFKNGGLFTKDPSEFSQALIAASQSANGSVENTMNAVSNALDYPFLSGSKYIIVVTDEPGDDNNQFTSVLAKANGAKAMVCAIWDSNLAPSSNIDELAAGTNGIELPLLGDWGTTLTNLATDIISHTSKTTVQGVLDITSDGAGNVRAIFQEPIELTAGQLSKVKIKLVDQYGNDVNYGNIPLNLYAVAGDGNITETGKFYNAETIIGADGKPSGTPIGNEPITISAGKGSYELYYYDTRSTGDNYSVSLGIKSLAVDGTLIPVVVKPQDSVKLGISIKDWPYYTVKITNDPNPWSIAGEEKLQNKLLNGMLFPMRVAILDKLNNEVKQATPLTINLSTQALNEAKIYGKFYMDAEMTIPVTQVTIPQGQGGVNLYYCANGVGNATVKASTTISGASSLTVGEYSISVLDASKLAIKFLKDNNAAPEMRKPMYIMLTDAAGHPATANADVEVKFYDITAGMKLYNGTQDADAIETAVIKTGTNGVLVFAEGKSKGEYTVKVKQNIASPIYTSATTVINVNEDPYYVTELLRGWNLISVPVQLKYNTMAEVIKDANKLIELAYAYDANLKKWVQVYLSDGKWRAAISGEPKAEDPQFIFDPMDAIYIKLKGATNVTFYPSTVPTGPYTKTLMSGWNLVGPALDLSNFDRHFMSVDDLLANIKGKYSQVISPAAGSGKQSPWGYVPGNEQIPSMGVGMGYWIYMKESAQLPGFSYTPLEGHYCGYFPYVDADSELVKASMGWGEANTDNPPPMPAAFYGSVSYTDGIAIENGVIEAIIDGVVRGRIHFENGKFGVPGGAMLIVQQISDAGNKYIKFLVNGVEADLTKRWSETTGDITELSLKVDKNAIPALYYQGVGVTQNKIVELSFSNDLDAAITDTVKNAISFAADGKNYAPLSSSDNVTISGNKVIITMSKTIVGDKNTIKINANAVKDQYGNTIATEIITAQFAGQTIDECFIATAAYGSKFQPAVQLLRSFRDKMLMTNEFGKNFVAFYYKNSPAIARFIAGNEFLKATVRILLMPIVAVVYLLFHPVLGLMVLGLMVLAIYRRRRYTLAAK